MTAPCRERHTISDSGLVRPSKSAGSGRTPARASSKTASNEPQSANHHETLNLQVSLWPTFQPAKLPEIRDPIMPKVHNDRRSIARSRRRGKGMGKAREVDILEQILEDEGRLRNAVAKAKSQSEWRRMWQNLQQMGEALAKVKQDDADSCRPKRQNSKNQKTKAGSKAPEPPAILRLPHTPPPLPPCLQCVLAGTCCSLTIRPYAKGFVNDKVSTRQPRPPPCSRLSPSPKLTVSQLARLSTMATVGRTDVEMPEVKTPDSNDEETCVGETDDGCSDWDLVTSGLPWKRQHLEQRQLRKAIVRGSTDSPFLQQPPTQCARCKRNGDLACLQQSRDLTNTGADIAIVQKTVAWFASSGPPPLSLLPQHNVSLMDQIRYEPLQFYPCRANGQQRQQPGTRPRSQDQPWKKHLTLEAIFCRDPNVLTASGIASKAQGLLEQIQQKYPPGVSADSSFPQKLNGYKSPSSDVARFLKEVGLQRSPQKASFPVRVRPATKVEVSRPLPRRSWMNVYAGRGVATAIVIQPTNIEKVRTGARQNASDYRHVPPALPAWHASDPDETREVYKHKWQDYFLDVSEGRAAAQFQKDNQLKVKRKPLARSLSVGSQSQAATVEPRPETQEERQARIAQMAHSLDLQFQEKRAKSPVELDSTPIAREKRPSESETHVVDLISNLSSWLEPEQAHRLAALLAGPVTAI